MPRRTIRLSVDADERLQSGVKLRGYANPGAFLRAAMDHELKGREETAFLKRTPTRSKSLRTPSQDLPRIRCSTNIFSPLAE
jgi:hypothetical protein